jgi:DNA-binding NtrC family response regulator
MLAATTLLVEDDKDAAESYIRRFADEGNLTLDWAENWEEALDMFRVAGYPLVIADYNLPGSQHGLKLLVAMKRLIPHSELILISGAMSPQAEQLAESIDFLDGFYAKRMNLGETLLKRALQAAEKERQPTDWRQVATGFLADPRSYQDELDRIDAELSIDVSNRD